MAAEKDRTQKQLTDALALVTALEEDSMQAKAKILDLESAKAAVMLKLENTVRYDSGCVSVRTSSHTFITSFSMLHYISRPLPASFNISGIIY